MDKARLKILVSQANHEREVYDAKIKALLLDTIGYCDKCGNAPSYNSQYCWLHVCETKKTEIYETGAMQWYSNEYCLGPFKVHETKCEP